MSQHNNKQSQEEDMIAIALMVGMLGFVLYTFAYSDGKMMAMNISRIEVGLIYELLNVLGYHSETLFEHMRNVEFITNSGSPTLKATAKTISASENYLWPIYMFPIILVMLKIYNKEQYKEYNRVFDGNSHIVEMSKSLPRILPIVHLDYGTNDEERGAFTYPTTPMEWAVERGVIETHDNPALIKQSFDPVRCRNEFTKDIKLNIFTSIESMDYIRQLLYTIYGLWHCEMYDEHNKMLDESAKAFIVIGDNKYKMEISKTLDKDLQKYKKIVLDNPKVQKITAQYVFNETIIRALFALIPKTTVAYIIWLKAIDKPLYYFLHHEGLEVCFPLIKGSVMIYEEEVKRELEGGRLIAVDEQDVLTKEQIIDTFKIEDLVRDLYYSLDMSGWMTKDLMLQLSDEQIFTMFNQVEKVKMVDLQKPVYMYVGFEFRDDNSKSKKVVGDTAVHTIVIYNPQKSSVDREITLLSGVMEDKDERYLRYIMREKYIYLYSAEKLLTWLEHRGLDSSGMVYYDLFEDAKDVYEMPGLKGMKPILEKAGLWGEKKSMVEMQTSMFMRIMAGVKNKYQDIHPVALKNSKE